MIPYALPFRKPYVTARGSLERREIVLLRIRDSDGVTGIGEGVPLSLRGGSSLVEVVDELEAWGERSLTEVTPAPAASGPAGIAIATALADAEARSRGIPLHELLDPASTARPVTCNATLTAGTPAQVLTQAEEWAADGFRTFKLKLGPTDGVEQVRLLREALGSTVKIRVDANEAWTGGQAARTLSDLEPFALELAEQPVAGLEAMAELRRTVQVPLVADEAVSNSRQAAEASKLSACDAVTVKLSKTGSLDASLGGHLPTYLSSALDGPVGIAAAAHVAQTLPVTGRWSEVAHGLATERLFSSTIAGGESLLSGATLTVPDGSGLGISIDESALEAHRL